VPLLQDSHSLNGKPNNLVSPEKERSFALLMLGSINFAVRQARKGFFDTEAENPNGRTLCLQNS
jgi:hypothetical protein